MATKEYFPGIEKIKFEGKDSKNPMAFRYYDAEKVINGKKMKDWLKFAMAWWHTLCAEGGDQFGGGPRKRRAAGGISPQSGGFHHENHFVHPKARRSGHRRHLL